MFMRTMEQTLRPKLLPDTVYADAKSASLEGSAFFSMEGGAPHRGKGFAPLRYGNEHGGVLKRAQKQKSRTQKPSF